MPTNSLIENGNSASSPAPIDELKELAKKWNVDLYSEEFAKKLDAEKKWPCYRDRFCYPLIKELPKVDLSLVKNPDDECVYLCGHSLGLQPKTAREYVNRQFDKWAKYGVYGHHLGELPWEACDVPLRPLMARLVGGSEDEVGILNFLSVNIHLMMIAFYQPTSTRFKILIEDKAFPSDHYAVESQLRLHNLDPKECMVIIKPREGEYNFRTEDIVKTIEEQGDSIALVFLSGVHYFTGQVFDIKQITEAAHAKGCLMGWDLAHAIGNVELKLHEWNVDFAVWCTYKYLNAGAGSIGGIFLHEKHFDFSKLKKLDGWWSHRLSTRFKMNNVMEYDKGAAAFSISNPSILLCSCLKSSLDIFDEAGMAELRKRSRFLTAYMEALLYKKYNIVSLTPKDPEQRGAQLSLKFSTANIFNIFEMLEKRGVVCDYRAPDVLRFSANHLYNTFHDLYKFADILDRCFKLAEENGGKE